MTKIFGHRGASGTRPENTMISFLEAEKLKADGIELDVQLSKDGEVVIIHDDKVDRTTNGKGYVKDLTVRELKQLNAGFHFQSGKYKDTIPTLYEFLKWFRQTNMICNIELKTTAFLNHELEEKTVSLVKKFQLEDRIILSSFNHYSIVYCYRLAPEIEIAPLYTEGIYMPWVYAKAIHAKGIHPYYKSAPKELVLLSQQNGIAVRPYTVNKEEDLKRYIDAGTDSVITDFPELAKKIHN